MLVVSIDYVPDKEFVVLDIVQGSTLYSGHTNKACLNNSDPLVEGSLASYTHALMESRKNSTKLMLEEAQSLGADAIINVRFSNSAIAPDIYETLVYGTAVKFKIQHTLGQF